MSPDFPTPRRMRCKPSDADVISVTRAVETHYLYTSILIPHISLPIGTILRTGGEPSKARGGREVAIDYVRGPGEFPQ